MTTDQDIPEDILKINGDHDRTLRYYEQLYYRAPFPYLVLDEKGIITDINVHVPEVLSRNRDQILGKPLQSFVKDSDHIRLDQFLTRMRDSGERKSCDMNLTSEQSTEKKIRFIGIYTHNPQKTSHEWFITLIESNLWEPSKTLEPDKQTSFLADLISHSTHPFAVAYPNGQIRMCNTSFESLLGFNSEELASLDWARDLTPDEWKEHEQSKLKELLLTGRPIQYEKEYIRKDGSRVPVELFVHLVSDANGDPQYYYSFISDITGRKKTEIQLKENEDRFKQLADNVEQVFWVTALNPEQVMYVNPSFERIWGIPAHELYKDPRIWTDHIHPDDKSRVTEAFSSWVEGKTPHYDIEYSILTRQRRLRWIHDRGTAMVRKDGVVVQVSGIAEDISHLK